VTLRRWARLIVRCTAAQRDDLVAIARELGPSVSSCVREAIDFWCGDFRHQPVFDRRLVDAAVDNERRTARGRPPTTGPHPGSPVPVGGRDAMSDYADSVPRTRWRPRVIFTLPARTRLSCEWPQTCSVHALPASLAPMARWAGQCRYLAATSTRPKEGI
jgi:hypothetical protein